MSQKQEFKKTELKNGIRVVTENHPYSRAVAVGIWVETGTRDEDHDVMGVSHALEHMVFKGSKKRTAYQLAKVLEEVGGDLNAYTTREYTCFHTLSLKDHLKLSVDVASDLVANPILTARDFAKEKQVILQEIAMTAENQEEYLFDELFMQIYPDSSLGYPILGTEKTIAGLTRKQLLDYYKTKYVGKNIVISASGALKHEDMVEYAKKYLGHIPSGTAHSLPSRKSPKYKPVRSWIQKESEQLHLALSLPSVSFKSPARYDAFVINTLLGGGMSSKLYQSIREKKGLAYAVYSQIVTHIDSGLMTIYAGTEEESGEQVIEMILKELKRLKKQGVTEGELRLCKNQLKAGVLLGADDLESRMTSIGVSELVLQSYKTAESVALEIERVSKKSVKKYIQDHFDLEKVSVVALGGEAKHMRFINKI